MASPGRCEHPSPLNRLLVLASTYPARPGDGTPAFVRDLALREAKHFGVFLLVPAVTGAPASETDGALAVRRFRYFFRRREDLANGAILDNLRARRSRWFQVLPFFVAEARATRRAVRHHRPDVIHAHWIIPQGLVATVVARKTPLLVTTLGGDLYGLRAWPFRVLKRRVVRHAQAVTVMSADMRQRVIALGADPSRVIVLPMGADLASFRRVPRPAHPGPIEILFVGRLVEKKGVPVLGLALRSLPHVAWRLTVVGDGPLRPALERELSDLPASFVGTLGRDALAEAYRAADVVVFPSIAAVSGDQDGLPVALLEAMGSGCAIVASDLPGIRDAVRDGVSGLLVPSGDPDALTTAIDRLARDPALRRRLGDAAARDAERFDVSAIGDRYAQILHAIAEGRTPPA